MSARTRCLLLAMFAPALACDDPPWPAPPPTVSIEHSAPAAAPAASTAAPVAKTPAAPAKKTTALEAAIAKLPPLKLARKTTPAARFGALREACEGGDAPACWAAAARYAGSGRLAGCGVQREEERDLKVGSDDMEADSPWNTYYVALACAAGDKRACHPNSEYAWMGPAAYALDRTHPGLMAFLGATAPKRAALIGKLLDTRDYAARKHLYQIVTSKDPLSADMRDAAIKACADTRDCDEIVMLLDQEQYDVAEVAPVRKAAGETMLGACLDGECGCGDAAYYLGIEDARSLDLARLGCEGGEADGCYQLGRMFETGTGVPKDVDAAIALYDYACPPAGRADHREEYSKLACDRLAAAYQDGDLFEADKSRALFYAQRACIDSGNERDHGPCLRLATELRRDHGRTGIGSTHPDNVANARRFPEECDRPSVREACAKYREGNK